MRMRSNSGCDVLAFEMENKEHLARGKEIDFIITVISRWPELLCDPPFDIIFARYVSCFGDFLKLRGINFNSSCT